MAAQRRDVERSDGRSIGRSTPLTCYSDGVGGVRQCRITTIPLADITMSTTESGEVVTKIVSLAPTSDTESTMAEEPLPADTTPAALCLAHSPPAQPTQLARSPLFDGSAPPHRLSARARR